MTWKNLVGTNVYRINSDGAGIKLPCNISS